MFNYYKVYKILRDFYSWKLPNTFINKEYEKAINVFPNKDQITFSCAIDDGNIQILLYNKTNLMNDSYIKNIACENNTELTKFYFNDNKSYLIYPCFKNCSDKRFENDIDCLNERENEENKKTIAIMIIIIIIIIIALLIVFIIIFRKYFKSNNNLKRKWKKGKEDEKLMKEIISDLIPK